MGLWDVINPANTWNPFDSGSTANPLMAPGTALGFQAGEPGGHAAGNTPGVPGGGDGSGIGYSNGQDVPLDQTAVGIWSQQTGYDGTQLQSVRLSPDGKYYNSGGTDVTSQYQAFQAWHSAVQSEDAKNGPGYQAALLASGGRRSTVLTAGTGEGWGVAGQSGTGDLLGGTLLHPGQQPFKTVLGGH